MHLYISFYDRSCQNIQRLHPNTFLTLSSRHFLCSSFFQIYIPCRSFNTASLHKIKNLTIYLKLLQEMTQTTSSRSTTYKSSNSEPLRLSHLPMYTSTLSNKCCPTFFFNLLQVFVFVILLASLYCFQIICLHVNDQHSYDDKSL